MITHRHKSGFHEATHISNKDVYMAYLHLYVYMLKKFSSDEGHFKNHIHAHINTDFKVTMIVNLIMISFYMYESGRITWSHDALDWS